MLQKLLSVALFLSFMFFISILNPGVLQQVPQVFAGMFSLSEIAPQTFRFLCCNADLEQLLRTIQETSQGAECYKELAHPKHSQGYGQILVRVGLTDFYKQIVN